MDCLGALGCDDFEVTKTDLDRFTDRIENVLTDDKGKKLFRNFMITCKMKDELKVLDFWDHVENLLNYRGSSENVSYQNYLQRIDRLIREAEGIEDLDLATMEKLVSARDNENQDEIVEMLYILKAEATKALRIEYDRFRMRFIPKK